MKNALVAASITIVLLLAGCANSVGKPAPSFLLTSSTGKTLTLDTYANLPLVVMFGSVNGCETCVAEAKNVLKPLLQETNGKVASLTISILPSQESNQDLEKFKQDNGATWDFARDTDSVAQHYGATQLTTVVVLDAGHHIVLQKVEPSKDEIKQSLGL